MNPNNTNYRALAGMPDLTPAERAQAMACDAGLKPEVAAKLIKPDAPMYVGKFSGPAGAAHGMRTAFVRLGMLSPVDGAKPDERQSIKVSEDMFHELLKYFGGPLTFRGVPIIWTSEVQAPVVMECRGKRVELFRAKVPDVQIVEHPPIPPNCPYFFTGVTAVWFQALGHMIYVGFFEGHEAQNSYEVELARVNRPIIAAVATEYWSRESVRLRAEVRDKPGYTGKELTFGSPEQKERSNFTEVRMRAAYEADRHATAWRAWGRT